MKIVITDGKTVTNGDIDLGVFGEFGELVCYDDTPAELTAERIRDADIVICNKTKIGRAEMTGACRLKLITLFATGYNNIDISCAKERGIRVCNAGEYSSMAVAQHVFAFILNRASKVARYSDFVADGGWIKSRLFSAFSLPANELYGKTIGIVGYGSIGHAVARIALAFGMSVAVTTRTERPDGSVRYLPLDDLLRVSDYITVHTPLTPESAGMFGLEAFEKCKPDAYFINTSRGGVVNEAELRLALERGLIAGAAVDVLVTEPMQPSCPLFGAPGITITPHVAWAPYETRVRLLEIVENNIRHWLDKSPVNVIC